MLIDFSAKVPEALGMETQEFIRQVREKVQTHMVLRQEQAKLARLKGVPSKGPRASVGYSRTYVERWEETFGSKKDVN